MEIQDRNSLLQMFFSNKENGNVAVQNDAVNNVFAEMIHSRQDVAVSEKSDENLSSDIKVNIKKDKDVPVRTEAKKDEKVSNDKTEIKDHKEQVENEKKSIVDEEDSVAVNEAENDRSQPVKEEASTNTEAVEKNDIVEGEVEATENTTGIGDENIATIVSDASLDSIFNIVAPVSTTISAPIVEESVVATQLSDVSNTANIETVIDVNEAKQNKEIITDDAMPQMQPLTEEESLLMEQAKALDEKMGSDKKIKVEVNVKEAKIADTIVKDVLQNRFEIDSLFQDVTENQSINDVEIEIVDTESSQTPVAVTKVVDAQIQAKGIAFAEGQSAGENIVKTVSSDAQVLSVAGKEVVFDNANTAKAETFARINETSSKDVFKGMGKEVIEQIKVNITKSAIKGVDTIDIQLKPEDLGKIQIKMHISKDGKLQAEIISGRPETLEILQKDVSALSKAFNDAGYDTDSRSFNFSFQNENQAREQQKDDSGLLKFIGDTLEQEADIAGNDNLGYDPTLGLNIRV